MALMKSGMNIQNDSLSGLLHSSNREAVNDAANIRIKSDRFQSGMSMLGSTVGLAAVGAVEAKKRGWFDDVGSVLNDIF
jgi:hypothetical protein